MGRGRESWHRASAQYRTGGGGSSGDSDRNRRRRRRTKRRRRRRRKNLAKLFSKLAAQFCIPISSV